MKLLELSFRRVIELGQEAFSAHEDCMRWTPDQEKTPIKKTEDSVRCKQAIEKQRKWLDAILEHVES